MTGAEVVIVLAVLGWFVAPAVTKLLNDCFDSLGISAEKRQKKLEEVKQNVLPLLKSVNEEAEGSPHRGEVEDWLQRLKGAYHDVEKALALLQSKTARRNGKQVRPPFRVPKLLKLAIPVLKRCRDILSPKKIRLRRRLRRRLDDLEKIAGEAQKLRTNLLGAQPETAAVPGTEEIARHPQQVLGRGEDREEIIRRLKMEPAAGIPILPVVGRPGVGNTTLAQKNVREELEGEGDRHFDLTMWVDASRNFNASEIMKDIIQQASIASEPQDPINPDDLPGRVRTHPHNLVANLDSPEELRLKMNKMLNSKKFLLVIDYVWCGGEDHRKNWDTLFRCLGECCLPGGSKILVTSQANDARRLEGEITRLTAAAEVKEGEIAALERRVGALKEAEEEAAKASAEREEVLRKRHSLLVEKIREKDDALMKLGERNSSLEEEIIKLKDALVVFDERNAVLEGEKKNTAAVLRAVLAGAAAAAAVTAVYLRRRT